MLSLLVATLCAFFAAGLLKNYYADRRRTNGPFAGFWRTFVFICVGALSIAAIIAFFHVGVALLFACVPIGLIVMLWILSGRWRA